MPTLDSEIDNIFKEVGAQGPELDDEIDQVFSSVQSAEELPGTFPELAPQVGATELGPPGAPASARMAAALGDTPGEKLQAIKKVFPEAELQEVVAEKGTKGRAFAKRFQTKRGMETYGAPSGKELAKESPDDRVLLFRPHPSQPWVKFDPGVFEKMNFSEMATDVGEFVVGDLGQIAGEIGALTPAGRGAGFISTMGRIFAGGTAGELAQEGVEQASGIDEESLREATGRAAGEGAVAALGGALTAPFSMAWNIASGRGMLAKSQAGKEAVAAAERLGLAHGPMVHEAARWPLIQRMGRLAATTSDRVAAYREAARQEIVGVVKEIRKRPKDVESLRDQISALHNVEIKSLLGELRKADVAATLETGGEALKVGLDAYRKQSSKMLNDMYSVARQYGTPEFDATSLVNRASEMATDKPVRLATGEIVQISQVSGPLKQIVDRISKLDPNVRAIDDVPADEQLRALRQELFDLKQPGADGIIRNEQRLAGSLYREINNVLKNPTNQDQGFVKAWQAADGEAAKRFDFLESAAALQIARSESPGQLARMYAQPLMSTQLKELQNHLPPKSFKTLQLSFQNDLIEKMAKQNLNVREVFSQFDDPTLDLLVSPAERTAMTRISDEIARRRTPRYLEAIEKQNKDARVIDELVKTDSTSAIGEFVSMVQRNGGKNGRFGTSVSVGLRNMIAERILRRADGVEEVADNILDTELARLMKTGAIKLLRKDDLKRLRDVSDLAPILKSQSDAGASISGSEQARTAMGPFQKGYSSGMANLLENVGVAFLTTNRVARNILLGKTSVTKADVDYRGLRLIGAVMAQVNDEIGDFAAEEENAN